jgi:hypothetical protein
MQHELDAFTYYTHCTMFNSIPQRLWGVRCIAKLEERPTIRVKLGFGKVGMQIDTILIFRDSSSLHKSPDMQNAKHMPIPNTLPYHPVTHDDTRVPPKCRSGGKPTISRHPRWLVLNLKRVLSAELVELRP